MLQTKITVTVRGEGDYYYDACASDVYYELSYTEDEASGSHVISAITFATKEEMVTTARAMLRACATVE